LADLAQIAHPQKQVEWLGSRIAISKALTMKGLVYKGLQKDEFHKPHLINLAQGVSLTHTHGYAAAVVSTQHEVGIDLENISEKIRKVAHKFLAPNEAQHAQDDLGKMAVYWSAKEALYKIYGKRGLFFATELLIEPFELSSNFITKGRILTQDFDQTYRIQVHIFDNCVLTVAY
jgi:4'-phosphopantetheinyl transferase